jgi:hypothetical protein
MVQISQSRIVLVTAVSIYLAVLIYRQFQKRLITNNGLFTAINPSGTNPDQKFI